MTYFRSLKPCKEKRWIENRQAYLKTWEMGLVTVQLWQWKHYMRVDPRSTENMFDLVQVQFQIPGNMCDLSYR